VIYQPENNKLFQFKPLLDLLFHPCVSSCQRKKKASREHASRSVLYVFWMALSTTSLGFYPYRQ
jgi:hypothetical protein